MQITANTPGLLLTAVLALLFSAGLQAQIPRLPDSRPDFQGLWTNETDTPVERPAQFADRRAMTAEVAAAWRQGSAAGLTDLKTLNDPEVYGRPWTAEVPMCRLPADSHIYEYACHEGNYAIVGALSGARWQEYYAAQEYAVQLAGN